MDYTISIADISILLLCVGILLYMESLERKICEKKSMPQGFFVTYMAFSLGWVLIVSIITAWNLASK